MVEERARRRGVLWSVVAIVVVAVVAVAGVVAWPHDRSRPASAALAGIADVPLPTPHSFVVYGHTYVAERVSLEGVLVPDRTASVLTLAVFVTPDGGPGCRSFRPSARLVSETSTEIRVAAFDYGDGGPGPSTCSVALADGGARNPHLGEPTVRLAAPIGDRTVIDAEADAPLAVVDPDYVPRATWLPAGFHLTGSVPAGRDAMLTASADYGAGRRGITIEVGPDPLDMPSAPSTPYASNLCAEFWPSHQVRGEVCNGGEDSRATALPLATLLRVAAGVR